VCAQHERVHIPVSRYGKMLKMQIFFQKAKQTGVIIIQRVYPVKCEAIFAKQKLLRISRGEGVLAPSFRSQPPTRLAGVFIFLVYRLQV